MKKRNLTENRLKIEHSRSQDVLEEKVGGQYSMHHVNSYLNLQTDLRYDHSTWRNREKTNSTRASHVVTHRTTGRARRSLTSAIGRERVQYP